MSKITMTRDLRGELPALPDFDGLKLHTWNDESAAAWNWIHQSGCMNPTGLEGTGLLPEQVYFSGSFSSDVAAVAVRPGAEGEAELADVTCHPWQKGLHFGRYAALYALHELKKQGYTTVKLALPPEAGAAIHMALKLGFESAADDETRALWPAALAHEQAFSEKKPEPQPLWEGLAPYSEEGDFQPSMRAYPVAGSRGAVVVCPGGGYAIKADHEGSTIARMLNAGGVSAYVLDYRVKPCHYEAPLSDAKRAIRTLRALGYEKVAILGFSAGGHLCCSAATLYDAGDPTSPDPIERLSSRPDGFIACYAVVSFLNHTHRGSAVNLLGDKADDLTLLRRFSAEQNVTRDTPPAFIWHTVADGGVPVENSLNLAKALSEKQVSYEMHLFPEGPHGLGLATGNPTVAQWAGLCQRWLARNGYCAE